MTLGDWVFFFCFHKVTLGDWVYVSINLETSDTELKIVVPECWATADEDPLSTPNLYFIQNKYVTKTMTYCIVTGQEISLHLALKFKPAQ